MSNFVSIAIDGPAGAGKSTMARACAQALGYLDRKSTRLNSSHAR